MTKFLIFENLGEIDPRVITTMGVNVKPASENPIGFFGTGLKYGLAVALRLGAKVEIHAGKRRLRFEVLQEVIRGKEFGIVVMREYSGDAYLSLEEEVPLVRLGITTELGCQWEPWMSVREFFCNALDEGGSGRIDKTIPSPQAGITRIIIQSEILQASWASRSEWYVKSSPIWECPELKVHADKSPHGFYRGLRVATLQLPSEFTYNVQSPVRLTEDRTVGEYSLQSAIACALSMKCENEELLERMLLTGQMRWENRMDWNWSQTPSETFIRVVLRLYNSHRGTLPETAWALVRKHVPRQEPQEVELSKIERMQLERAKEFLAKLGYPISERIVVVESLGDFKICGLAERETKIIWLPKATFGRGTKFVASTLLEEHLHIAQDLDDCSRDLQNWLFDRVISLGEELQGEPI